MSNRATSQTKLYKQCEQFVLNAYRSLEEEPQKLKAFITLFHRAKKPDAKILESQMKLVNIIQDSPELVRQLNLLVPEEFKVPELDLEDAGQQEGDDQIDINAIFTELHKKRPEKVKELITLLQNLKNKQSSLSVQALRESVYKILEEEPKLLNAFMRCVEPLLNESANGAEEEHEQDKPAKGEQKPGRINKRPNILMPTIPRASNPRDRRRDPEVAQPSKDTPADSTWPSTLRYEMYLFEYLEKNLSEEAYSELAKIIFLYTECIISAAEVFQMTKPLFEGNDNYFNFFQEIIHIREPMRRKNTILFKPLNEVDFKKMNCERARSYTKLPENFSYLKNPFNPKNALSSTILNKEWVSVPQGSEVNFKVNTRNTYEVNLFLGEDERYEFDVAIYNYKTAMKWLQGLETARTDEEKAHLVERLLKLKVIQKVYGNNNEIIDLFKKNPAGVAKVFIDRIQIKLAELNDTKWNQAKRKWVEVAAQNFHRALDHRSFYFKQSEKKLTSHKNFTAEAQIRHTEINIKNNMQKAIKYLDTLDTFEGLSNGQSCNHPQVDGFAQDLLKKNSRPRKVLPVYRMLWTDKKIIQDIVDIINLRIQTFHATLNEKDKILRYFKIFMTELINMPYKAENTYDVIPDQTMVSNLVTEIESKIFTKIFHFNVGKIINDANKESPENGAPAANNKMSVEEKKEKEGGKPKKSEMEVEKAGGKGKGASGDKMEDEPPKPKDDGESLEDDLRLDSGDEEQSNIKEMEYEKANGADTIFLPTAGPGEKVFYSTQHIYCLIRFYFTLYERFVKARETAQEFEINEKTILLPHAEKDALAEERYNVFKWVLVHLLRSNIDNEKYEDLLRSIFGNKAYLMFYIDRIVHSMILTIQKIIADDITLRTLNLFTESDILTKTADPNKTKANAAKNKNWPEHVYLAQLNQLTFKYMNNLQNTSFFRFLYNPETQVILVSMHDSPYKDWKDKTLEPVIPYSKAYLSSATIKDTYLKTSRNPVYLMRNKELNRKKSVANEVKVIQENDIEWKYLPNTLKQVTDKVEQEEYLFVVRKKEAPEEELRKKVCSQLQKATRFQLWYKKLTKS